MKGFINLGPRKSKAVPVAKPVQKQETKSGFQFELAEPDDRIGMWLAKDLTTITRYRIPFVIPKGREVEVVEDKGDKVLVHIDKTSTIYIDSEVFDAAFERVE